MRIGLVMLVFVAALAVAAYPALCPHHRPAPIAAASVARGRALGAFDPAMSGVCRFSCAAPEPHPASDVTAQPGVPEGALTQCPVSGVVFAVDGHRPHVTLATGTYVLCCEGCAKRFRKDPRKFVSL